MRLTTVLLLTLVLIRSSAATESLPPLRRPELRARHVVGVSVVAAMFGAGLAAADLGSSGRFAGIGLISTAGLTTLTTMLSELVYGVGYQRGLRANWQVGLLDSAEARALSREKTPATVTFVGVATLLSGLLLCVFNLSADASKPAFDVGVAVSAVGATVSSVGSVLWSYAAGVTRGVREAPATTFSLSPTGLAGTF